MPGDWIRESGSNIIISVKEIQKERREILSILSFSSKNICKICYFYYKLGSKWMSLR